MKQTLVIGSTVADVLLTVPRLPRRGEDVNISSSLTRIGGCAYNVYKALRLFQSPARLCSPVGGGVYGAMVRNWLAAEGLEPFINLDEENGCCYCLIEADGERTFLSLHGAEYRFSRSWTQNLDYSQINSIFICGIDVEDPAGAEIAAFAGEHPGLDLYFAPGPRISHIPPERLDLLLRPRAPGGPGPVLHLNLTEAREFTRRESPQAAGEALFAITRSDVVITLGAQGCYYRGRDGGAGFIPGVPVKTLDTVGAGDAHCGAVIACLKTGLPLPAACEKANALGAAVAGVRGATVDKLPF
jgi:sugar/nucleoside kinase (ribokinase family)